MERAMNEADLDQITAVARKEIAPVQDSLAGLRAADERPRSADDKRSVRRPVNTPMIRIRRVGEGQKRYR
jgi:hypothetical protein